MVTPSPALFTVEAVRCLVHDDEDALHDICIRWVEEAVASGVDMLTAVGVLLHDAYDFAAMMAHLAAEDTQSIDKLLDSYALEAMACHE